MDFQNPKEINPFWNLADTLTVQQAAALIAGVEPNAVVFAEDGEPLHFKDEEQTENNGIVKCKTTFAALKNAINGGKLKATIRHDARVREYGNSPGFGERVQQSCAGEAGAPCHRVARGRYSCADCFGVKGTA